MVGRDETNAPRPGEGGGRDDAGSTAAKAVTSGSAGGGRGGRGHAKLGVKIALDIVMMLALVLLYKAKVLTLTYHEVMGLAILGLFLIHCLVNRSWIVSVGKRLFSPQTPTRTKVSYWLAIALAVVFILIVLSGVFISKILFKGISGGGHSGSAVWRNMHLFCSALSIILVGMHVGLYWDKIAGFFRKHFGKLQGAGLVAGRVVLAIVLAFGVYSVPTTSFAQWLACPVIPIQHPGHGDKGSQQSGEQSGEAGGEQSGEVGDAQSGEQTGHGGHGGETDGAGGSARSDRHAAASSSMAEASRASDASGKTSDATGDATGDAAGGRHGHGAAADDASAAGDAAAAQEGSARHADSAAADGADVAARAHGHGDGTDTDTDGEVHGSASSSTADGSQAADAAAASENGGHGGHGGHGTNVTLGGVLLTIAQFTSLIALFAAITRWIDLAIKRRGRKA